MKTGNLWDIFCRVIDNYGDIGVCWRLSVDLAARGERVRLWTDDASALRWMAPLGASGVEVRHWSSPIQIDNLPLGDILVEAFGCEIAPETMAQYAQRTHTSGQEFLWLNLEYLSAESFADRCHGLPSPVMAGPGTGLTKYFFYPGFTAATGGLLRETDLTTRQASFDRVAWLAQLGIALTDERLVSLFCYEPRALGALLDQLGAETKATRLLVTAGRATQALKACIEEKEIAGPGWNRCNTVSFFFLPTLSQHDFDHLLWSCDLNFVRGEDSLVRALWANKPFIWQIYPQLDNAHQHKLDAFLDLLQAPAALRIFHQIWNGFTDKVDPDHAILPALDLSDWQLTFTAARRQQLQQDDLVTRLLRFVAKNH